jgi:hypothetical protein
MRIMRIIWTCLSFGLLGIAFCQQSNLSNGPDLSYENHNPTDYGPLRVSKIYGISVDPQDVPIRRALVLLFRESDRKLAAHSRTDPEGIFRLNNVRSGKYRLVVKYEGFCSANVPIEYRTGRRARGELVVHMRPRGMDQCSYGALR